jgi:hypothetical protein
MRATGFDDVVELQGLALERPGEEVESRQKVVRELVERGEVYGRREDVVRGLAHVDVVVGMNVVPCEGGDHLVGVRVRARARAGLEDVDRKLVVELACCHPVGRCGDPLALLRVEQAELRVRACRRRLDSPEPTSDGRRNRLARDAEVLDGLAGLAAPELFALGRGHDPSLVPSPVPPRAARPSCRA